MKNVLNIAVFGLSLNSLEQIKEQILLSLPALLHKPISKGLFHNIILK